MLLHKNSNDFLVYSFFVLFLGSIYTLARKYQNIQQALGPDGVLSYFHQPIYQVFWLFLGMSLCLPLKRFYDNCIMKHLSKDISPIHSPNGKKKYNAYLIIFPSFCDVFATILDSTGLIYTHVSVHQMLKGFIVVFTFIISLIVFKRKYRVYQYFSIFLIFMGCVLVGKSNLDKSSNISAPNPTLGNTLCVLGQLLLSFMFIYEEYILKDFEIHIFEMVGWEGIWGVTLSFLILTFTFYFPNAIVGCSDNFIYASCQIVNNHKLLLAIIISSVVIGPFNYFGSGLTKIASASHRSTIDSLRMCVVWLFCVLSGFEEFRYQQMYGYSLMVLGSIMYNETISFESFDNKLSLIYMKILKKIEHLSFRTKNKNFVEKNEENEKNQQNSYKNNLGYVYLNLPIEEKDLSYKIDREEINNFISSEESNKKDQDIII